MVYKSGFIIYCLDSFTLSLYLFFLNSKKMYPHVHIDSISVPVLLWCLEPYVQLLRYLNSHTKSITFVTECGHINYVDFIMLITWMSGRGDTLEIKHWSSYTYFLGWWHCKLWVTILDEVKYLGRLLNKSDRDWMEIY